MTPDRILCKWRLLLQACRGGCWDKGGEWQPKGRSRRSPNGRRYTPNLDSLKTYHIPENMSMILWGTSAEFRCNFNRFSSDWNNSGPNLRVVADAFTCVTLASWECVSCREELVASSELSAAAIHALVGVDRKNDRGGVSRAGMGVEVGSEKKVVLGC